MQSERFIGTVKPCPECNKREIHIFHVDEEILFDIDLPKECDVFDADFHVFMCKNCLHLFQFSSRNNSLKKPKEQYKTSLKQN